MSNLSPSRRRFLSLTAGASVGFFPKPFARANNTANDHQQPYTTIDWDNCQAIGSVSHAHCRSQTSLDLLVRRGLRHLAISNYYPSAPCTPGERIGQFRVQQDFATVKGEGYVRRDFAWNEILTDPEQGWVEELPESLKDQVPFETGGSCFTQIQTDVTLCPNAEHHSMTDSRGHFNSVGSTFASGTFDVRGKYGLHRHGYAMGTGLPWREAFERIIAALQVPDGGGITINHPKWSGMSPVQIQEHLDFDPRVLGIEIWNQTAEQLNGKGWSLAEWDAVLATGRRCYGFAVSDHAHNSDPGFQGRNVLLVDGTTATADLPAACLRAYRRGDFYCSLDGKLQLRRCQFQDGKLRAEVSQASQLRVITAAGIVHEQAGKEINWTVPAGKAAGQQHVFVRVEADQRDGTDRLFSQAFQLA
ncbi:CehA/McbA family metallohydrolase domain-containing protein [Roseimaritima ulvae]|uniref:hypothetical protein n=1 Tax=Roseimaritima ulvae TaxID=980254 RepID=UPI0011CD57FD|nr:hypothetical protein [Roseimaritima ulvae]